MEKSFKIAGGYRRYPEISFLKGIAITALVIMHMIQINIQYIHPMLVKICSGLGIAGHYFFLCSGLGLYLSFLGKKKGYVSFISGRFFRIYLPYSIAVIICYLCPLCVTGGDRTVAFLSHIFLFKMFSTKYIVSFGTQYWFISTLFQFYILFIPLCSMKKWLGNKCFFIASLIASLTWGTWAYWGGMLDNRVVGSCFLRYLWEFSLGMIIADYIVGVSLCCISNIILLEVLFITSSVTILFSYFSGILKVFNDVTALLAFICIGLLLYELRFLNGLMIKIGDMSLEIFLLHILTIKIAYSFFTPSRVLFQALYGALVLIAVYVIAYIYRLILDASFKCSYKLLGGSRI